MVIRNSDGSVYELKNKTNPLLKTQNITGDSHIIHNFQAQEVIVRYKAKKQTTQPSGAVIGTHTPHPFLPEQLMAPGPTRAETMPVAPGEASRTSVPEPPAQEEDHYLDDHDKANSLSVSCWCQPAKYETHYDALYGESRNKVVWLDKFLFDGVIEDTSEMSFKIWAQVSIKPPSIIFVRPHRRWWKVVASEPNGNGYTMTCMPSDTRLRFD